MDGCSGKRGLEGQPESRKGGGIVPRDRFNSGYSNAPVCSRVGCSAGKNPLKGTTTTWIGSSDRKEKSVLSSFRSSSNGKEIIGTSSKARGSLSSSTRSEKKLAMSEVMDSSDSSSSSSSSGDEVEARILDVSIGKDGKRVHHRRGSEPECSNLTSGSRIRRGFRPRFGLNHQGFCAGPSSQATPANTVSRHSLRNRSCRSMLSGVVPSGFGLEKRLNQRVKTLNVRKSFGESSSSSSSATRGKNITEPPAEERSYDSNVRVSSSDNRQGRNYNPNSGNDGTRRSVNSNYGRARFSTRETGRNGLSSITIPEMPQTESSNHLDSPVSLELFHGFPEVGTPGSLMSPDAFHGYNLDGISEVLSSAMCKQIYRPRDEFLLCLHTDNLHTCMLEQMLPELDRIERDIELNYEELLVMETGLLLGGLSFYDRHRDMRLDIDNMSYEELLALEEKIGTVSTALSEEAISKCLKTTIYPTTPSNDKPFISPCGYKDDSKCSICQEEYTVGDEVGRLHCEHMYHVACAQEWLRLKNWCPICRASAEPSSHFLPSSSASSSSS